MTRLTNAWLDFVLDPENGRFFLESLRFPGANLKNAAYNLRFSCPGKPALMKLESLSSEKRTDLKHRGMEVLSAVYRAENLDLE